MTFEDDILGPKYTDLVFDGHSIGYQLLYAQVLASEARAALDLDFLAAGPGRLENAQESPEEEEEDDDEDDDDQEQEKEEAEGGNGETADSEESDERDQMDLDVKEESTTTTTTTKPVPARPPLPQPTVVPVQQQQQAEASRSVTGFARGLEHYFATYIWVLIYMQEYTEAVALCKRYRKSILFGVSPIVTASARCAAKFGTKTSNDTLDYAGIYKAASSTQFAWEDEQRGGSYGLAQLVKDAVAVFQTRVYVQLRDSFRLVKVGTVAMYLLPPEDEGDAVSVDVVLAVLNSMDAGWVQDPECAGMLVPPSRAGMKEAAAQQKQQNGEVRRQWLNELVKVASVLEQKSIVE